MPVYKDEQRGTWYFKCNYRDWQGETRTKLKRGFATKREAQQGEREFLDKQSGNMNMKLAAFVEVYFNDKGTRLKERSIMTKRTLIETKIIPYFGEKSMNEITAVDIIKWQNMLMNQEYSPTYLRMIQNQLTALFNHAERFYDLRDNPCKKVDKMGRSNARELNFLTKDEYEVFIKGFGAEDKMYRIIFQMLFWLGCRIGEVLALTASDIDLENGTISVSKTYFRRNKTDFITSPKTESSNRKITQNAFAQTFKDLGYPTTMKQAVTKTSELVWQKDEDGNLKPQMKRNSYGGADWVETQKAVLQDMMLKEFGWERFYKGSNPRGNLTLSDYRRE